MKKLYLIILFFGLMAYVQAQPTMTYPTNSPQIGDIINLQFVEAESLTPGPAGANQTWDFSALVNTDLMQVSVVDPAATPYGDDFPDANIAFNSANIAFAYAIINGSGYYNIGVGADTAGVLVLIVYSDYMTVMEYPFTYNTTFNDDSYAEYTAFGVTTKQYGSITVTGDAHGTINLPTGTFNDVLRVKTEIEQLDSLFLGSKFLSATTFTITEYGWYGANSRWDLFKWSDSGGDISAYYSEGATDINEEPDIAADILIYPNPATGNVQFSFNLNQSANISFSLINQLGQKVIEQDNLFYQEGAHSTSFDVSALPEGIYFVNLSDGNKTISRKILVR